MSDRKFDPAKLDRLNDPERLLRLDPDVLWDTAGVPDADIVVDIGAGTGMYAFEFARRMRGGVVNALDTEPPMVEWMRTHVPDGLGVEIVAELSDENDLPLPGGNADLVVMLNLHHELDSPPEMLAEVMRVLKPGGRLLIADWKDAEMQSGPPAAIRIPAETICVQVGEAGFEDCAARRDLSETHAVVTATKPRETAD
jgi:ubiquinone/menaquinone biosynthesis C-methylase UbiE